MVLFWLLVGHAVADFALQSDVMAKGKNKNNKVVPSKGQKYIPCWPYWLSAHALIHAGAVVLATQCLWLGIAEFMVHWVVDFLKCENKYGPHFDQGCHIVSKLLWWLL